ncbi:hypothetical protein IC229_00550 [Spirosoma sp. BT702]|uniref:Uncharacterized protein n=1 Tax=Spirosoma profusum TaxID=2771354 RepID=A0A926XWS3_9BACT|nr:hypothetical protein [Spirosoma profusum]MBD2699108.1 hypothetical protein [Spirosoma profusum]
MNAVSRGVVYSLATAILVLLLCIMALLGVAYNRHQHLEDATIDLKRNLSKQETKIVELQERLEDCDTVAKVAPADTAWATPAAGTTQAPPPKW